MKIEVHEKPVAPRIEYPCLMKNERGDVILFFAPGEGIRMSNGDLYNHFDSRTLTPFTGSVTLSND